MDEQTPNYRSEFLKSPHHVVFGLLTLGLGFISAELLPLIAGGTIYALGWIYLPDLGFFRSWVDRRHQRARQAQEALKVAEFVQRREGLLASLSPQRREKYRALSRVCQDIERASADSPLASADPATDPRLKKLDELMWTYLRLLGIEESLERFLETERRENIPQIVRDAETEIADLKSETDRLQAKGQGNAVEIKQRYMNSRLERLEVLRKRQQRCEQAEANLALVVSEQDRLDQQIKLIRADAVATKNADALTARIDATVEHLDQTNKWLSELDEFKDLVADMPSTDARVGYESATVSLPQAPPVIAPQVRRQPPLRQRQAG